MAKKYKEKCDERIGDTVKRFDAGVRRHLAVPVGSGGFRRKLRCTPLKEFTLPVGLRLVSDEICSDQSRTINGS